MTTTQAALTFETVAAAMADVLTMRGQQPPPITPETRLDSLELDSLDVAEFFVRVEERTGLLVEIAEGERIEVAGDLLRLRLLRD